VADAGPDQCVHATRADGSAATAQVPLVASGSRDLAGAISQYTWRSAKTGCAVASGETASVVLPVGLNDLVLEVSDM
jgi:hypothetical protein